MRKALLSIVTTLIVISTTNAQTAEIPNYDFWVGKWNLTWDDGDGKTGRGTNNIVKIMDGKVIQENFKALEGKFKGYDGISMSMYNARNKEWKQIWMDNQGGYIEFTGGTKDGNLTFETRPIKTDTSTVQQRMVFYDITENSLSWDWEGTQDGGKTWNLRWRINYQRAE